MAKTMYAIQMDFANALRQADQLEKIAGNVEKLIDSQFQSCLDGVSAGWKGESAKLFLKKGNVVGENVKKLARNLRNTAQAVRQIAKTTYEAERSAYEIAQERTYHT